MKHNVTGRDDHVINKALVYAILAIERLPKHRQELSDKDDMEALLRNLIPDEAQRSSLIDQVSVTLYEAKF